MSIEYHNYLREHIDNVQRGIIWLYDHIPYIKTLVPGKTDIYSLGLQHDNSKYESCEYDAYDSYFYGKKTPEVKEAFNYAWLHHIHNNPHHWQHWILIHDDEPMEALKMPEKYVIEMIADWWSFSWKTGNLKEIFDWYEKHKEGMMFHPKTKEQVEKILDLMKEELEREEFKNESDTNSGSSSGNE